MDTPPTLAPISFHFHAVFMKNFGQIIGYLPPPRGWPLVDLRGAPGTRPPGGPTSFIYNSTSGSSRTPWGKSWIRHCWRPRLGNSGSATGLFNVLNQSSSSFADLRIGCPRCTPFSPKFIQFHAVFGKCLGSWGESGPGLHPRGKLRGNWLPPQDQPPPGPGTPPPEQQSIVGDTVNEWAVCILLECNLVFS